MARRGCPKGPVKDDRRIYEVRVALNKKELDRLNKMKELSEMNGAQLFRESLEYYSVKILGMKV